MASTCTCTTIPRNSSMGSTTNRPYRFLSTKTRQISFQQNDNNYDDPQSFMDNVVTDDDDNDILIPSVSNRGLASIITQGIQSLEKSAADIEYRTRNSASLSRPHKKGSYQAGTLEPRQLAEGQRILDVACECLEKLTLQAERGGMNEGQKKGLFVVVSSSSSSGYSNNYEPIVLLECVVNRTIKQAKLYWTLPYEILLNEDENHRIHSSRLYKELTTKIQHELNDGGGAKLLSRQIHAQLSSYYAPKIIMVPATKEMVAKALLEYML